MLKKLVKNSGMAVLLIGAGFWIGAIVTSNADGLNDPNQPGSVHDPLVTKSYVDEKITQLVRQEIKGQVSSAGAAELQVVTLKSGQVLYAGKGTELIVRNGKTIAVSDSSNGIPDVTQGADIPAGEEIANNHLLVFPSEGRGITPAPETTNTIFVMVRGEYVIVDMEEE